MTGSCEHCHASFDVKLVHNGFNDTSYAYCSDCGKTALLNIYSKRWPRGIAWTYAEMPPEMEQYLQPCECGGRFSKGNSPRCPVCKQTLSADEASTYIEEQSPGTRKGWRWQRNWYELYCIIINDRCVGDNFTKT